MHFLCKVRYFDVTFYLPIKAGFPETVINSKWHRKARLRTAPP